MPEPEIPAATIGRGDFAPLRTWPRANVHSPGSLHATDDLIARATGKPLDPKVFEAHLTQPYLG